MTYGCSQIITRRWQRKVIRVDDRRCCYCMIVGSEIYIHDWLVHPRPGNNRTISRDLAISPTLIHHSLIVGEEIRFHAMVWIFDHLGGFISAFWTFSVLNFDPTTTHGLFPRGSVDLAVEAPLSYSLFHSIAFLRAVGSPRTPQALLVLLFFQHPERPLLNLFFFDSFARFSVGSTIFPVFFVFFDPAVENLSAQSCCPGTADSEPSPCRLSTRHLARRMPRVVLLSHRLPALPFPPSTRHPSPRGLCVRPRMLLP